MFTYQVRPRVFHLYGGETPPAMPADCEVRFHFRPLQPFGVESGGGRTMVRAVAAKVSYNANNGEHTAESATPLNPLDVTLDRGERTVQLRGATLTVVDRVVALRDLDELILGVYVALPALLNVGFADPPWIWRVDGIVGGKNFGWELAESTFHAFPTTQDQQQASVLLAWRRMALLEVPQRRRLIAGLHYFHLACRLARQGSTVGEFLAEVVLNLAKTLEVLFPPAGDGRSREAVREALRRLGFSEAQIEGNFLPAMALRDQIDVAHVELGLFTLRQLKVIHAFTERAEAAFKELLDRLLSQIESGVFEIAAYDATTPRAEALALIARLERFAE